MYEMFAPNLAFLFFFLKSQLINMFFSGFGESQHMASSLRSESTMSYGNHRWVEDVPAAKVSLWVL